MKWITILSILFIYPIYRAFEVHDPVITEKDFTPEYLIDNYSGIAKAYAEEFGIPYEIIMAQAILESSNSKLAVKYNNFFGHKCFSRTCHPGHCVNMPDDHHKDFFRIYRTPEDCFANHARWISTGRYRTLVGRDCISYAHGLKDKGYATDPKYAEKLTTIIKKYKL